MAHNKTQFQKAISLADFINHYGTEEQCFDALFAWRWPNGFQCPHCGYDKSCRIAHRKLQQCHRCHRQTSVTAGTIFESTKLPLTTWFLAIYLTTQNKKGISAMQLHRHLSLRGDPMNNTWRINTLTNSGTDKHSDENPADVYHRLIASDRVAAPASHNSSPADLGLGGTAVSRYMDPAFQRLEIDNMWTRVWQAACREEEIAEVGDVVVYDLAEHSYLVTRVAENEIRAYRNACLHRGTRLCSDDTSVYQFRCPYHGWTWGIDGQL